MALTRDQLMNVSVFMARAAEAGTVKTVNDIMAFAETLAAVNTEVEAIDKKAGKKPETK